ncbi:MAG: NAD(P)/FAD-dependent oxidoreductase, partial [Gammaproteobacteria bacterium]|nr:NAD(P)/FAD-dependent oxidoreductase [Gammaproteobacteria bacterium]
MRKSDKALGMHRDITRRDFLNGVGVAISGSLAANPVAAAVDAANHDSPQMSPDYYPPTLSGMRGSHPGSFEAAHLLRDGARWNDPAKSVDTGEEYDLIVVGGGISGLAAAWFYRQERGPDARILIVDNHDDFGGHAKRNEFHYKDRMLLELGGTAYIEDPRHYPENARRVLDELGIDIDAAQAVFDHDRYPSLNLRGGVFFAEPNFDDDRLVAGKEGLRNTEFQTAYITLPAELENSTGNADDIRAFLDRCPLSDASREEIVDLYCSETDPMAGMSTLDKIRRLRQISYLQFLQDYVGASDETIEFLRMWRASYMGNGVDLTPAYSAFRYGLPGTLGLGIEDLLRSTGRQPHNYKEDIHFPDGNASIARLLVRKLIPDVAPGDSMHDIVAARFDYTRLDQPASATRIRLNATATNVRHLDSDTVEMTYLADGEAQRVRGKHCILACYHSIVPHICPELPEAQKKALGNTKRMPLVTVSV